MPKNQNPSGTRPNLVYNYIKIKRFLFSGVKVGIYYPELSSKMAMKIGGTYHSFKVVPYHFEKMAAEIGCSPPRVLERVGELIDKLIEATEKINFTYPMAQHVIQIIQKRCQKAKKLFAR